mmetsp:Transcript_9074/g.9125  ORF Transcript_9074/g.9125 Transcript_9074/m.9125 type:complete len:358 (-) Transcript_9074:178-1251(-)|eukprot:CAMPEP_0182417446 /NCGR_PEP_ID=MMETSP1167-20130531/1935_1 /TAXON_ID=2988 /ORGANISM="Mallomonas Sp, Strain CCMP3275" /LENGTH=357 /DNA_ID=CAMNT_0024591037 /DNA_START=47 /DNA_END=1120 /DNA_ORIENTATION=-
MTEEDSQYDTSSKLVPKVTISDNTSEVFCVRFSPDGKFLATGCGDGAIRIFNVVTGKLSYNIQGGSNTALPTTAIRFRPVTATTRTKNVFLASNAAGTVQHWHMTSSKCLHSMEDNDNQVYALDYNNDGTKFVTAGKDAVLRYYDEATKTQVLQLMGGTSRSVDVAAGHSNRVFSTKFVPQDDNLIISGGWDNTIQLWDVRVGLSIKSIYGAHICGDSLDIVGNEILAGSWRPENQLEVYDMRSGDRTLNIPWGGAVSYQMGAPACMLYAAQFSKEGSGRFIVAGGSGVNEAKVFDHRFNNSTIGTITGLSRGIFAVDFSPDGFKVAVAGGDSTIRILEVVSRDSKEDKEDDVQSRK